MLSRLGKVKARGDFENYSVVLGSCYLRSFHLDFLKVGYIKSLIYFF